MSRKREFQRIYNKIDSIAKEGKDYVFEYYKLIDDLVSEGSYLTLSDVMTKIYNIDINSYPSIDEFKRGSYKLVRFATNYPESIDFKSLFKYRNIYNVGEKYYDTDTNLFLGEIREFGESQKQFWYINPNLQDQSTVFVEYRYGLLPTVLGSMSTFLNNNVTMSYVHGDLYKYENKIWNCFQDYTYTPTNKITPTFSSFWKQVVNPTYSIIQITSSQYNLFEKWNLSIDGVKGFIYSDPNSTNVGTFSFDKS